VLSVQWGNGDMPIASEKNEECALCPNNWRFPYSYYTALEYGKGDEIYLPQIYQAESESDIPHEIKLKYDNKHVDFLYIDDSIAIFQDVDSDSITHLLAFPVKHIDRLNILKYPTLFNSIICAANMIVKLADLVEAYISISTKNIDYIPHFHVHIQSKNAIDYESLKNLLYPKFYLDSEFFV
jgi:diadenosine tetraphosphate (Ap4A) HIT family hydrolase